jgi:hypothetical protein
MQLSRAEKREGFRPVRDEMFIDPHVPWIPRPARGQMSIGAGFFHLATHGKHLLPNLYSNSIRR